MYRNIRIRLGIAIILFLSIVFLAYQGAAGASRSTDPSLSTKEEPRQSPAAAKDDDCDKDKKGKDRCGGTVKPPKGSVLIPVTGEYSIGGFCTLSVELNDSDIQLDARLITPLPGELPDTVQKIRQGCLLTYSRSNEVLFELPPESGNTTICFAALPNKQMTVYFHNTYSPDSEWAPLETTALAGGIVCAPANASGTYIATFTTP